MFTSYNLFLISFLYAVCGIAYLFIAVRGIIKRNELRIFDLVRLMYSLVYGFIPFILYLQESNGHRNLYFYDYSRPGIGRIYLMWFLSIVAYGLMNLAYWSVKQNAVPATANLGLQEEDKSFYVKKLTVCGIIALVVGWSSLYLWTRAYGSLTNFIAQAARIRSGKGSIYNPFAFVKHFVAILQLSLYSLFSAVLYERPKLLKKIFYGFLIALSLLGNYLYFMASDSRITIIFIGLAALIIGLRHRKKEKVSRYLIFAGIICFILLNVTMLADTFTHYMRYGEWRAQSGGFVGNLTKEFRFIISSDMRAIKAWVTGDLQIQIGNDLLSAITSWIPERFLPFKIPVTLWKYNTSLYSRESTGTNPTSLVATSVYELGLVGTIVFPLLFGFFTAFVEKILRRNTNVVYADVYFGLFAGLFVQMVSHNQISTFVTKLFPAFLFFLISIAVDKIVKKKVKAEAAPIMPDLSAEDDTDDGKRSYDRYFDDPIGYVEDDED